MLNSLGPDEAGFFGDVGECAVAVVVKEMALAEGGDEDVVVAVVVVIADGYAHAHTFRWRGRLFG